MNRGDAGRSERILWMDGLKIAACMFIMAGHFYNAFIELDKNAYSVAHTSPIIIKVCSIFLWLLDGGFWVRVFCITAGFLAALKTVESFQDLLWAVFLRYLRFVLPFTLLGIVLFLIERSVGYHAVECGAMLKAKWLAGHNEEPIGLIDELKLVFLFDHKFDAALWTVIPIFFGTGIVYLLSFLLTRLRVDERYRGYTLLGIFLVSIAKYNITSICISSCVLGASIYWLIKSGRVVVPPWISDLGIICIGVFVTFLHERCISALRIWGGRRRTCTV